jgi:hypothetical protein
MTNYNLDTDSLLLDFDSFSETGIELSPEQVEQAVRLSDRIPDLEQQWQTYLNALALLAFTTWLEDKEPSLVINTDHCSVQQPSYASFVDGVFNLEVGEFKVCLLTRGVAIDDVVTVSRAVLDLPAYIAHFYVLVDVVEEQAEVNLNRFIRYDQLCQRRQASNLIADADWTYDLPLTWFNGEPEDLLLYLRCLEPNAIALPSIVPLNIQLSALEPLIPQLQSGVHLPEILTWEQGSAILSNPSLLQWLYELQTNLPESRDALTTLRDRLANTMAGVTQTAINVKSWLNNELDALAQNLAWTMLFPPTYAPSGLRDLSVLNRESPPAEFEAIITQLRNSGEDIPTEARGACQDFNLATYRLRLFAVTWTEVNEDIPEWNLLLVLGAQPNSCLPQGLQLEVKESDTILDQKIVAEDTENSYIYTRIIGELSEQFTVSIILTSGENITFPKFVYQ